MTGAERISLTIDQKDMGKVKSAPQINYWDSDGYLPGEHEIKVTSISANGEKLEEERVINILPVCVECPEVLSDVEGNLYSVIQFGNQCWMGENLKTRHFPDGTPLKNGNGPQVPEALTGWYFSYEGDSLNALRYGYLYTWATVMNGSEPLQDSPAFHQGIAPDGWHVPEVEEWRTLIDYLGGVEIAGSKLKIGPAGSGFDALPGGCCLFNSSYLDEGKFAYFWTATPTIVNHAYHIVLPNYDARAHVLGHQDSKRFGYSVRCVKN